MNISIVVAGIFESEMLRDLGAQTFNETFASMNSAEDMELYLSQNFNLPQTISEINEDGSIFYVAYVDEDIVGYARLRTSKKLIEFDNLKALEIERIYALKEFIGKGIGKELMLKCIETAKNNEFDVLWLGVWEHNPKAIAFYKSFGFEVFGEHDFMLGNDLQRDLLMKLSIK